MPDKEKPCDPLNDPFRDSNDYGNLPEIRVNAEEQPPALGWLDATDPAGADSMRIKRMYNKMFGLGPKGAVGDDMGGAVLNVLDALDALEEVGIPKTSLRRLRSELRLSVAEARSAGSGGDMDKALNAYDQWIRRAGAKRLE